MRPPPYPEFDSHEIGEHGRLYDVWKPTQLFAFGLSGAQLPDGAPAPQVYLYAFLERRRWSYWNWTPDAEDLRRVMARYRCAQDPDCVQPEARDAAAEPPTIRPQYNRDTEFLLKYSPGDLVAGRLDLSPFLELEPERDPPVLRLLRKDDEP